jgi:serine/threonine-protein kinase
MAKPVKGTQLKGYTLVRMMARGGMGEVYEATENKLQRRVALKVIAPPNPEEHDAEELIRRFLQEARMLAQLNHPNIVIIYSIDSVAGVPFIAMEYIEGVSFRDLLEEFTFSTDGAVPLFLQMLEGLRCLHENRIIHRDLKPHNILLRPDGGVKILDFGIAKHQGGTTVTSEAITRIGVVVGTLPYMPPEVKSGVAASARSDIWSLGAIFFECLTGERLVAALGEEVKDVPFTSEQRKKIPSEMRQLIQRMCAPRPSDRHENVAEVIDELQRLQRQRPPVTSQIWSNLSKKVEEVAQAKRRESSTGALSARVQQLAEASNAPESAPVAIRESSIPRSSSSSSPTHGRQTETSLRQLGKGVWVGIGVAVASLIAWLALQKSEPHLRPIEDTPSVTQTATPGAPLALKEPAENQMLWLEPSRIPTLTWTIPVQPGEYDVQLASDPSFQKILAQEPATGNSFRPSRVLEEGFYAWRLWSHAAGHPIVGPGHFGVSTLAPLVVIGPDNEHDFSISDLVSFQWHCKPGAKRYRVQVASDSSFTAIKQDFTVNGCQAQAQHLIEGDYTWRVRIDDVPEAQNLWSEARSFSLQDTNSLPTVEDKVRSTPERRALAVPRIREPKQIVQGRGQKAELAWTGVPGAKGYLVQFSLSRDFSTLLSEERAHTSHLQWHATNAGRMYWRVAAMRDSERGNFSTRGVMEVLLPPVALQKSYRLKSSPEGSVSVEWPSVPGAEKYLVQVSRRRDLASAHEHTVTSNKANLDVSPGTYYMRVAAADASGEAISGYSNSVPVEVIEGGPEGPQLLSPPSGARAVARSGRISILFSWSKVTNADTYYLEIAGDPEFNQVLERRSTKDRGSLLKQAEFKGRAYWRVRAKTAEGFSSWSKPSFFELK